MQLLKKSCFLFGESEMKSFKIWVDLLGLVSNKMILWEKIIVTVTAFFEDMYVKEKTNMEEWISETASGKWKFLKDVFKSYSFKEEVSQMRYNFFELKPNIAMSLRGFQKFQQ